MFKHLKPLKGCLGLGHVWLGDSTAKMEVRLDWHQATCPGSEGIIKFCSGIVFWGVAILPTSLSGNKEPLNVSSSPTPINRLPTAERGGHIFPRQVDAERTQVCGQTYSKGPGWHLVHWSHGCWHAIVVKGHLWWKTNRSFTSTTFHGLIFMQT